MDAYKDMFIVTDTKETDAAIVNQQFMEIKLAAEKISPSVMDRIIPQIYYPAMLEIINNVHEFQNVIYTLYQSTQSDNAVVQFAANHKSVTAITMPPDRAKPYFIEALSKIDKAVFVHTINKFDDAYKIRESSAVGIYTDYLY
jgi:glycerophosphoryl diester phosphodiesterase